VGDLRGGIKVNIRVIFPLLLIALDLCAAAVYGWYKDYTACGYWTCAAGISTFALMNQMGY
jgi:hypothetical protein